MNAQIQLLASVTPSDIITDSPISFPGLFGDWEFTASSVALNIGHGIYWYGILMSVGVLLGLWLCMKQAHRFGLTADHIMDMVLWGVPLGIVGARTYYVIFNLSAYQTADGGLDWGRAIAVWDGGGAIYGTVIACVLLALVYSKRKQIRFGALTDACVMGLFVGQIIGRWGNFMNREAFGVETTLPWRMRLWTSTSTYVEVHPTFLYECLWNLLGLALVYFVITKGRRFDGENTCFYFLWYGIGRFWIESLRTDSLYLFDWTFFGQPIRISQALSLMVAAAAAAVLVWEIAVKKRSPDGLQVNQHPLEVSGAPEEGSGTPEEGNTPEVSGAPKEGSGAPKEVSGAPEEGSGTPEEGSGAPEVSGAPKEGSGAPEEGSGAPEEGSGTPEEGSGTPEEGNTPEV